MMYALIGAGIGTGVSAFVFVLTLALTGVASLQWELVAGPATGAVAGLFMKLAYEP